MKLLGILVASLVIVALAVLSSVRHKKKPIDNSQEWFI